MNGQKFVNFGMLGHRDIEDLVSLLKSLSNKSKAIENIPQKNTSATSKDEESKSAGDEKLFLELEKIKSSYGNPKNLMLKGEISRKQLSNFCNSCKISNPNEILALIDTTLLKSGKDGLAFCNDRIVWRNFAFEEPQSIAYSNLYKDLDIECNEKELLFYVNHRKYTLSVIYSDLELLEIGENN